MKTKSFKLSGQGGFSLVELLVVIAVIAIIAAIAIPNIANITSQARIAKDQRNAQNIASVASAAVAAGYAATWADNQAVYNDLVDGVEVPSGTTTMQFGISTLSVPEQTGAFTYLLTTPGTPSTVNYQPGNTPGS